MTLRDRLQKLYHGDDPATRRFHIALAVFDIATIIFVVVSSFFRGSNVVEAIDFGIGLAILAELAMRIAASQSPRRELLRLHSLADIVVIISLIAPIAGEGFAFLRALRILRLLRSYQVFWNLRPNYRLFKKNEETIVAAGNLGVFLFVVTALVYETQHRTNELIRNYLDALYFTVATLTTTGYGDITLTGEFGRLVAVIIMIVGVSLFLRLIQVMIRPGKVEFKCPDCGLKRHEYDAVHCKACGRILNIEDEGSV